MGRSSCDSQLPEKSPDQLCQPQQNSAGSHVRQKAECISPSDLWLQKVRESSESKEAGPQRAKKSWYVGRILQ